MVYIIWDSMTFSGKIFVEKLPTDWILLSETMTTEFQKIVWKKLSLFIDTLPTTVQ